MLVAILPSFPYLNRLYLYLVKSTQKLHTTHGWCTVHIKVYTSTLNFLWNFRFWSIWMLFARWRLYGPHLTVNYSTLKRGWIEDITFLWAWNMDRSERLIERVQHFPFLRSSQGPWTSDTFAGDTNHLNSFRIIHSLSEHFQSESTCAQQSDNNSMLFDSNSWNDTWG